MIIGKHVILLNNEEMKLTVLLKRVPESKKLTPSLANKMDCKSRHYKHFPYNLMLLQDLER